LPMQLDGHLVLYDKHPKIGKHDEHI